MSFGTGVSDLPPSRKGSRAAPRRCPIFSGRQLPRSALACQVTTPAQSLGHHWRAWGVRWGSAPLCTQAWTSTDPAAPPRWTLPVTERREERGLLADLLAREQICGPPRRLPSLSRPNHTGRLPHTRRQVTQPCRGGVQIGTRASHPPGCMLPRAWARGRRLAEPGERPLPWDPAGPRRTQTAAVPRAGPAVGLRAGEAAEVLQISSWLHREAADKS